MRAEASAHRDLPDRELREQPEARVARRAYERWVTSQRVWDAIDREGITEDGGQAAFIATRLWPDLPPSAVSNVVRHVRERAGSGRHLVRPRRAEDVVGSHLADLMRAHGYPTEPLPPTRPPAAAAPGRS